MPSTSNRDRANLLAIRDAVLKIEQYVSTFKNSDEYFGSPIVFDATLMNFVVIGEMVERLSSSLRERTRTRIDWQKIKDFRNLVAHDYMGVDAEEVWQIIHHHLPPLLLELERIERDIVEPEK